MTKQQNKYISVVVILCSLLEILAIIGAYVAHYFTKTRMGMLRHMAYLNGKWEKEFPIDMMKWIVVGMIIIFIIFICVHYIKEKRKFNTSIALMVITIIINLWTVYYLLFNGTASNYAYYIISICLIILTVFQNISYCCFLIKNRD